MKRRLVRSMRGLRHEGGGASIEVALVLPVVFLMMFGFINFSLVICGMGNANFASRAALRYATLHSNTSYKPTSQADLNAIVRPYIITFPTNTWSVSPYYYAGNVIGSGVYMTVTVTYSFTLFGKTYTSTYNTTGCGSVQQ